jgi:hypothetical protein
VDFAKGLGPSLAGRTARRNNLQNVHWRGVIRGHNRENIIGAFGAVLRSVELHARSGRSYLLKIMHPTARVTVIY